MQDNRSSGPAFVFGVVLGAAIAVLASSPKTRKWMNEKSEWAKTDGKEALGNMKEHAREGMTTVRGSARESMEAVRHSAKAIKQDASALKPKAKNAITDIDE